MSYIDDEAEIKGNGYIYARYSPANIVDNDRVSEMGKFIDAGGSPNFRFAGLPLLAHARSVEMAKLLIDRGADIHYRGHNGMTPFLLQALSERIDIMKLLLDIDPTLIYDKTGYGENALYLCISESFGRKTIYNRQLECVKVLLANEPKIDVNMRFPVIYAGDDPTALDKAVRADHTDIIKLLLEHGAKPELEPGYEKYPGAKIVKQFLSNRRNKTMYSQAYRGLAEELPENVIGNKIKGFLEGATPGPYTFPSRHKTPYSLIRNTPAAAATRTPGGSSKTRRRREQRARAKAREIQSKVQTPKTRRRKSRK
jgi:hypothetical protein